LDFGAYANITSQFHLERNDNVMSLLKWCDEGPATVPVEASVDEAIRTMIGKAVGAVAVIDEQGVVAGMFTERDVLAKFALSGRDPKTTPVRELMSSIVEMATEETTPSEALAVMLERHYRHMPVVDEQGKVLGVCSIRNILEARVDDLMAQLDSTTEARAGA
ncbi:MAG: CBS domain-containing protein, partial [Candidatus Korobacteraceae bacterium]